MPSGKRLEGKVAIVTGAGTRGEIAGTGQAAAPSLAIKIAAEIGRAHV